MRKFNVLISCMAASLMLVGCTTTEWHKPGINNVEKNKAITRCKALALEKLPPDNKISSENNDGDYKIKGDRFSDSSQKNYDYIDANEDARELMFNSCMYDSGWDSEKRSMTVNDIISDAGI